MSSGSSPKEAIPIVGVSTRAEVDAEQESHLNTAYGAGSWTLVGRSAMTYEGRSLEQVDVTAGDPAQMYFDLTGLALDNDGGIRGIWDDNDQRPAG